MKTNSVDSLDQVLQHMKNIEILSSSFRERLLEFLMIQVRTFVTFWKRNFREPMRNFVPSPLRKILGILIVFSMIQEFNLEMLKRVC